MRFFLLVIPFLLSIVSLEAGDLFAMRITADSDPLSVVGGCVNALSGQFFMVENDLVSSRSGGLRYTRIYDGGSQEVSSRGYGCASNFPKDLIYMEYKKGDRYIYSGQQEHSLFLFNLSSSGTLLNGSVSPKVYSAGYTNTTDALLMGEAPFPLSKVRLHEGKDWPKDKPWTVTLPNGTERTYERIPFTRNWTNCTDYYYVLKKEKLPNGLLRHYSYVGDNNKFEKIWVTNPQGSRVLDEMTFNYGTQNCSILLNNGRKVSYSLVKMPIVDTYPQYAVYGLHTSSGEHLISHRYKYMRYKNGDYYHYMISNAYFPDWRGIVLDYHENIKEKTNYAKVKNLNIRGPGNQSGYQTLYTFDYSKNSTLVTDAFGNKTTFYKDKHRLVKISQGDYRSFHYEWDAKGNLVAKRVKDSNQKQIKSTLFTYDGNGNPTKKIEEGAITQSGSNDQCVHSFAYENGNRYLKTSETLPNGTKILYSYKPQTNLIASQLTLSNGVVKERTFHSYDENAILIQTITDDGLSTDSQNLEGATYRLIAEYQINLDAESNGYTLPEAISEYAQDPTTEEKVLIRRKEIIYTAGDLIEQEHIYDQDNQYAYSNTYEYNKAGLLIRKVNPLGEETLYQYDSNHNVLREELLGSGKCTLYSYDRNNRLVEEKIVLDTGDTLVTTYTNDLFGNRLTEMDPYGAKTTYKYDAYSRLIQTKDPYGHVSKNEYDLMDHPVKEIDLEGNVTTKVYNIFGKPLEIHHPDGSHEYFYYDCSGNLIKKTDVAGTSIHYTYDYQNRVTSEKTYDLNGNVVNEHAYQYKGKNLVAETDNSGIVTQYIYDYAGRLVSKKRGDIEETYLYDALGRRTQTILSDFVEIKIFDNLDRVVEERIEDLTGTLFRKKSLVYDINGNVISEKVFTTDEEYSEMQSVYNGLNEVVLSIDAEGNETHYQYIRTDHKHTIKIDPLGQEEHAHFDLLNRISKKEVYHAGQLHAEESFCYSPVGNMLSHAYEVIISHDTQDVYTIDWEYDSMGRVVKEIEQGEKVTETTYKNGRKETILKPDGTILFHAYDGLGRLSAYSSSNHSIDYSYHYDPLGNLTKVEDHAHHTVLVREYDVHGRMVKETLPSGKTSTYRYDKLGRLTKLTLPDHSSIHYTYNPADLIQVERGDGKHEYRYNLAGDIIQERCFNGDIIEYAYDSNRRLIEKKSPSFHQLLAYDPVGNITHTMVNQVQNHYSYDPLYQLLSEEGAFNHRYDYDSLNNRRSIDGQECLLDELNQLLSVKQDIFTYDQNGNRTAKNSSLYTYDALNRLTSVDEIAYSYDSFGRLLSRNDEEYVYFKEFDLGTENCLRILGKETVGLEKDGKLYTVITDYRGSVVSVLDGREEVVSYDYGAFGEELQRGDFASPWKFCSQRTDSVTGLIHFFKRVYDPETGRWLTPDPAGYVDGPNLYAYVHNNPLRYGDPDGLTAVEHQEMRRSQGTFWGSAFAGAVNDTTWGLSSKAFGDYVCDNWQSQLGYALGTGVSMVAGLAYGGTEAKIAGKALGFLGRNLGRLGRLTGLYGRRVKQISNAEATALKVVRSERFSVKPSYELNQFDRAASQLSQTGKDNIRTLRGWAQSKGWKRYSEPGKPEKWGIFSPERGNFSWYLEIKPQGSFRPGLESGSHVPRFDARINIDSSKGSTYINPFTGTTGNRNVGTHIPLEKMYY